MQVGYFRLEKDNIKTRKLNAISCHFYGLEMVYFEPKDINMNNDTINGQVLTKDGWIRKTVDIPKIINNKPFLGKQKAIYDYLERKSKLMIHSFGGKEIVTKKFIEEGSHKYLLIPTKKVVNFNSILDYLQKYKKVVLKPVSADGGRGIYAIEQQGNRFLMKYKDTEKNISSEEFKEFYNINFKNRRYLVQKFVNSITKSGNPFDLRIQFEKNGKGIWQRAQTYARIGIYNKVVSNVSSGGAVTRSIPFLKSNFGESWKEYNDKIKQLARSLPFAIERMYDFDISTLAVDLGIDEDGKFYMYEINSFPGGTFARGEIAMLRAAYCSYLFSNMRNKSIDLEEESIY